jgi:hypothetical protein
MGDNELPEGFEIRFATEDDNDQLVEVSRASAIRLGKAKVVVDPGDDYFAAFRLMEEWTVLVVTHGDRVVGVQCACSFPGRFEDQPARISQILHTRFHPDYARLGLWSHLQSRMLAAGRERAASFARGEGRALAGDAPLPSASGSEVPNRLVGIAYVAAENETVQRLYAGVKPWASSPFRVTIRCADHAEHTRRASTAAPADAPKIAAVLNDAHHGQELFLPYTEEALRHRLERAPDLYSWSDVVHTGDAVVGVWHSPETRVRTEDGDTTRSRRALVLDHGFRPGREDQYEELLRHACATAADAGYDHLSVFTADPSPTSPTLLRLAETVERYDVIVPFVDPPKDVERRGVYVDQAYF